MSRPRPPEDDDDPNIEPDLYQAMIDTDPRRKPPMTYAEAEQLAEVFGSSPFEVLRRERQRLANWDRSEDPEGYWWTPEDVDAILRASPEYGRG